MIKYEESGLKLNPLEKSFFVNPEGNVNLNGENVEFYNSNIRTNLFYVFLAFYSKYIGQKKSSVTLNFQNDKEILKASMKPRKYIHCLSLSESENLDENIRTVTVNYAHQTENFKVNLFQLYTTIPIVQELYDGRVVQLTAMEREIFLIPEVKVTFYPHEGTFEPLLLESEIREVLLKQYFETLSFESGFIYYFKFKNGDRDLVKSAHRILKIDYEKRDLDSFSNEEFYENLKDALKGGHVTLSDFYKPNTEEVVARSIVEIPISQ